MFMAVRLCLRYECKDSLRLSRYSFCQDNQNWSSLCRAFFRIERRRVMLSMGLKSRSRTSSIVVTNIAVELVTATKWLGVTAELLCPSTLLTPFGFELTPGGASTAASCIEGTESGKSDWESTAWPCNHSWLLLRVDEFCQPS